ncbi:TIR domain-containing protein [Dactylosporangium cerinum]|uniref:TIR domain-containing protein n=1 Tax=Dactylosporangium cerinum TaxID=1434730 RepID=A0ABV9WJ84_9ACTN
MPGTADPREVFVVHGRDEPARVALWRFLQALDLHPLDWEEIVRRTGRSVPYLGQVLAEAFAANQAAVVLCTPDDGALLHPDLRGDREPRHETELTGQVRPNVLIEMGMALALQPDRTVIIEIGDLRPASDLAGLNVVRFDGTPKSLLKIAQRLEVAGCAVNRSGTDWLDTTPFEKLDAYRRTFRPV